MKFLQLKTIRKKWIALALIALDVILLLLGGTGILTTLITFVLGVSSLVFSLVTALKPRALVPVG